MKPHAQDNNSTLQRVRYTIRVRYAETDQMKVAHHANYFIWFEAARSEFCRIQGIDYKAMEEQGMFLPIVECHCRFRLSARYDDALTISIAPKDVNRRTIRMIYEVHRGDTLLAEGETLQMLIGLDGKPRSFPKEIEELFRAG